MNTKLGPILTKKNVKNFMTKIRLRLGMLVNTTPDDLSVVMIWITIRIQEFLNGFFCHSTHKHTGGAGPWQRCALS